MARFSGSFRAAGAGSTTLPSGSLYAPATVRLIVREISASNTTDTAVAVAVARLSSAGTQGSGLTELEYDTEGPTPNGTLFNTHTVGPTIDGELHRVTLAAQTGATVVWRFGGAGLYIPAGTANGIGVVTATGTGQVLDLSFTWDE